MMRCHNCSYTPLKVLSVEILAPNLRKLNIHYCEGCQKTYCPKGLHPLPFIDQICHLCRQQPPQPQIPFFLSHL